MIQVTLGESPVTIADGTDMTSIFTQGGAFICNDKYNHKKIRVRVDQPVKAEQRTESEETHKTAEEDRKYIIQVSLA